ncbi:insulin-like growth factor-binding protein 4 [Megalops cyprinoides]|uniref:insulin-like growth factor-binding protein 4 n=1 Tax=Megalops cyprinoides TaxID=118141 RepID=UPI0018647665|nr:insulin-like growth factor-binding protein 4 [Megalops cyprinoides]
MRSHMTLTVVLAVGTGLLAWGSESPESGGHTLQALHCPPCERIHCTPRRALRLQCKGGLTTGICGCCPVCARTAGESCGGTWDYLGKCDEGLVCVQDPTNGKPEAEQQGICKEVLNPLETETCRPACSWEFCRDHPSEICSARSVALERHECHGSCQHTSCSSCLVLRPPVCTQTCGQADAACMVRFGKCVQNHLSEASHPVCHQNLHSNAEGYFACLLPACPNVVN